MPRVLIESTDEALEDCVELARSLRGEGCVVVFDVDGETSGDYRWVVSPVGKGKFKLFDRERMKKIEVASAADIKLVVEG